MKAIINKSIANGCIKAQPSKSYAHRLLIASLLSNSDCVIENIILSNDILETIECIKVLGRDVIINDNKVIINVRKDFDINSCDELVFNCNESGSTFRFFIPIALTYGKKVIFKGSKRLIERGIGVYEDICFNQNIECIKEDTQITFIGKLKSDVFNVVGNISSQFISGLLFALPLLENNSKIVLTTNLESKSYIDITLDVLNQAGVNVNFNNNEFYVFGSQKYNKTNWIVEGDYSNCAFIDAFNYLNGKVKIEGLNNNSLQGDKKYLELFPLLDLKCETIDISNCIDLGPILFCFASLKNGATFVGTNRLAIKESNRIKDIKEELEKFNVNVIEENNKVIIDNKLISKPSCKLNGHNDHRIVMALCVMLSVYGGEIDGIEAINKSYPNFFNDLEKLGIEVCYE